MVVMFCICYCEGHCSESCVQYLVLRETLLWFLCSVSGAEQDTALALLFSMWCYGRH